MSPLEYLVGQRQRKENKEFNSELGIQKVEVKSRI